MIKHSKVKIFDDKNVLIGTILQGLFRFLTQNSLKIATWDKIRALIDKEISGLLSQTS